MRTRMVEERIGEWVGPVDEAYDWAQHGHSERNVTAGRAAILKVAAEPDGWRYSPSGFSSFLVVCSGMYDGWPFWKPTPAIGYVGPLGSIEVAFFYDLSDYNLTRSS